MVKGRDSLHLHKKVNAIARVSFLSCRKVPEMSQQFLVLNTPKSKHQKTLIPKT